MKIFITLQNSIEILQYKKFWIFIYRINKTQTVTESSKEISFGKYEYNTFFLQFS